ncbi:hypothetical protein [Haladaptatus sp. CMSO5]|uniref:hypothetical protein n=1 Tax=Haladaptatus sp. CMSO5 TaxID=3120514 RepID=UPI002FCE1855
MVSRRRCVKHVGCGVLLLSAGCLDAEFTSTNYSAFLVISNESSESTTINVKIAEIDHGDEQKTRVDREFSVAADSAVNKELFQYESSDFEVTVDGESDTTSRKISVGKENLDIEIVVNAEAELTMKLQTH